MSDKLKKALTICAILLFGAVNLSTFNFGSDDNNFVHVETYEVKAGDTFWDVAHYYHKLDNRNLYIFEYMDELRELNPQLIENHCQLQPNDLITIKYVRSK